MIEGRYYKYAIWAVDPGASNLSGVANSLIEVVPKIEEELEEQDGELQYALNKLKETISEAWKEKESTDYINRHPMVASKVKLLSDWAFMTATLRRVPSHPIFRLMIDQMRQLAGLQIPDDPYYFNRWDEAFTLCEKRSSNE